MLGYHICIKKKMLWDRILDKCSINADSVSESESAARGNEATPASVLRRCFFYTVNVFYLALLF